MTDSIADIMGQRDFSEPPEIQAIKSYVRRRFDSEVGVKLSDKQITIIANGAAFASALRSSLPELIRVAETDKKIYIRIG